MSSGRSSPHTLPFQPTPPSTADHRDETGDEDSVQGDDTSIGGHGTEHNISVLQSGFTAQQERWIEEHTVEAIAESLRSCSTSSAPQLGGAGDQCIGRQHQTRHLSPATSGQTLNIPTLPEPLKPHEIGYYAPDPSPKYKTFTDAGKYLVWHDIYAYISHIQDLSNSGHGQAVTSNLSECLRGPALQWWISELTQGERDDIRKSNDLSLWGTTLISRFKLHSSTAHNRLGQQSFTMENVRCGQDIQEWIYEMLYLTKCSLHDPSTFYQLLTVWIKIGPELRCSANMKEPGENTSVSEFVKMVRDTHALWESIAQEGSQLPWEAAFSPGSQHNAVYDASPPPLIPQRYGPTPFYDRLPKANSRRPYVEDDAMFECT